MTLSKFKFSVNFYLVTVTKKKMVTVDKEIVKATKIIVISTDTVVVCTGTESDCQYHRYLLPCKVIFFVCTQCFHSRKQAFLR